MKRTQGKLLELTNEITEIVNSARGLSRYGRINKLETRFEGIMHDATGVRSWKMCRKLSMKLHSTSKVLTPTCKAYWMGISLCFLSDLIRYHFPMTRKLHPLLWNTRRWLIFCVGFTAPQGAQSGATLFWASASVSG